MLELEPTLVSTLYYGLLVLCCLVALADWRRGIYGAIVIDFLRDPVRKLDPAEPVLITLTVLLLWGVISIAAWSQSQGQIRAFLSVNPYLLVAFRLLVWSMIPGCIMAAALYAEGYKLIALGLVSYLAPAAGVLLGAAFARQPHEIFPLLRFYCLLNGLALVGVVLEYADINAPALGGLRGMNWVRYSGDEVVRLIGGFYRSPDIMGLHAAQVVIFCMILTTNSARGIDWKWLVLACFAGVCLLLSGRRKMLGIPLVFLALLTLFCHLRKMKRFRMTVVPPICGAMAVSGILMLATDPIIATEYTNYASTLVTEGAFRARTILEGSTRSTLAQSGIFGSGIGSATQGTYHLQSSLTGGWQEDGVSRLFRELGLIGVVLVVFAATIVARGVLPVVKQVPNQSYLALLQLMLFAAVLANLSSFLISHQQFSGDPASALIVLLLFGIALSLPQFVKSEAFRNKRVASQPKTICRSPDFRLASRDRSDVRAQVRQPLR
jgi:hypothetical protein